jgi:hypothetical protein
VPTISKPKEVGAVEQDVKGQSPWGEELALKPVFSHDKGLYLARVIEEDSGLSLACQRERKVETRKGREKGQTVAKRRDLRTTAATHLS